MFNLLTSANNGTTNANAGGGNWIFIVLIVVMVLLIAYNYISGKKRREQAEAEKEKRNAIRPGFQVTTIGGILGTVVEVNDEANTFVLQTGTEENPSYIKFDKVAIYSSVNPDEVTEETVESQEVENEEIPSEEVGQTDNFENTEEEQKQD